ncbi:ferredoxin family protein [Parabacteroides sp. PF5-6]|uniref:ferredoxin family protein n=1 Tax=Parabacteroides sp. PF5-6 TaxID=1742403 RepID=UPI00240617B0|nr:ferredoxin family protein [Parabacteroides sp. PF5-6]MDF9829044.1 ferredoxin [Parabacteroides sp. PF5-6]
MQSQSLHQRVTVCACASRSFIDKDKVAEIAALLKREGYAVSVEADLCKKVITHAPEMAEIASGIILACHTRAVRSHLEWLGLEAGKLIDMRQMNREEILSHFSISPSERQVLPDFTVIRQEIDAFPVENGTDAWYPVIDKSKCIECGKCHDFCLFGVYTVEDKRVRVVQPQNCKNNCPACARMCPSKAIIFPKYEKSPINGGTAEEETFNPEEMDRMYRERLRMRLQQRRASVSLFKENDK